MNKCLVISIVMLAAFAIPKSAFAVLIEFELPRNEVSTDTVEEDGFLFSALKAAQFVNGGGLLFRNPPPGALNAVLNTVPYNGTHYAVAFTGSEPILRHLGDSAFNLYSLDIAEYSQTFDDPHIVHIVGYYLAGGTIERDLILDGVISGSPDDFETFGFGQEWRNLRGVSLFASVPWATGVGFSIDNISVAVVDQPSTLPSVSVPATPGLTLPLMGLALVSIVVLTHGRRLETGLGR